MGQSIFLNRLANLVRRVLRVGKMWEGDNSQSCEEVVDQVGKQRMWGDVVSGETLKTAKRAEEGPLQVYAHRSRSALWGKL